MLLLCDEVKSGAGRRKKEKKNMVTFKDENSYNFIALDSKIEQ